MPTPSSDTPGKLLERPHAGHSGSRAGSGMRRIAPVQTSSVVRLGSSEPVANNRRAPATCSAPTAAVIELSTPAVSQLGWTPPGASGYTQRKQEPIPGSTGIVTP